MAGPTSTDRSTSPSPDPSEAPPAATHPRGAWIRLGRVGGVRIFADPMLFVALGALYLLLGEGTSPGMRLTLASLVLGSVLIHELGHAWMARARGLRVGGVYLHLLPFAYVQQGTPQDVWRVALAGPALSATVGLLCFGAFTLTGAVGAATDVWIASPLAFAAVLNLAMGVLNLLPTPPLDGGRAAGALLRMWIAPKAASRIMLGFSVAIGVGVASLARVWPQNAPWLIALGAYVVFVGFRSRGSS